MLKSKAAEKSPKTKLALKRAVTKVWQNLTQNNIDKCICALPKRLNAIIDANGAQVN